MRRDAPLLSVVTVAYNSAAVLPQWITAVRRCLPEAEIIVVDNASADATAAVCHEHGVRLLRNEVNAGFGRACNAGVGAASAEHVLLLNPDLTLTHADPEGLQRELRREPFGLVAPEMQARTQGGSTARHWAHDLAAHLLALLRPRELPTLPLRRRRSASWWPAGAMLLVRRGEFLRAGGFDSRYFLYYEDRDLARRYRSCGLPVRTTAALAGAHELSASSAGTGSASTLRIGWSYLSWIQYLSVWHGRKTATRAARWGQLTRRGVAAALALLERITPGAERIGRKRRELEELDAFIRGQATALPEAEPFCPAARDILARL